MGDNGENDAEKYAALRSSLESEGAIEPKEQGPIGGPEPEQYDARQHGVPQQPQQEHGQHYQDQQLPEVQEDPIQHFDRRMERLEQHTTHRDAWHGYGEAVRNAEANARRELGDDYDDACRHLEEGRVAELERQFPDNSQQAHILAHQYGLRSAAELRAAVLNRDRVAVAHHAISNRMDPAEAYFNLAVERGYRPQSVLTQSQRKGLGNAIMNAGDDQNFQRLWEMYKSASQTEDEFAKRRR